SSVELRSNRRCFASQLGRRCARNAGSLPFPTFGTCAGSSLNRVSREKVLLISSYFPPAGGIGVQRAGSLARYLPENGIDVFVLTARSSVPTMDADLIKLVPKEVQIHRTWTLEPPFRLRKKLWSRLNSQSKSPTAKSGL